MTTLSIVTTTITIIIVIVIGYALYRRRSNLPTELDLQELRTQRFLTHLRLRDLESQGDDPFGEAPLTPSLSSNPDEVAQPVLSPDEMLRNRAKNPLFKALAAKSFARAWNRLDASVFLDYLAESVIYRSCWMETEIVGRHAVSAYLRGKIETVSTSPLPSTRAVAAEEGCTVEGEPCVLMYQGNFEVPVSVVTFLVGPVGVIGIEMRDPSSIEVTGKSIYPT